MHIKIFDEEDDGDLENDINDFIKNKKIDVLEIQYQVAVSVFGDEQVFCFSAMIIYQLLD